MYGLLKAIIFDNGPQFSGDMVIYFCRDLEVKMMSIFVVHPQDNGQKESTSKVILKGLKKKLDDTKGLHA